MKYQEIIEKLESLHDPKAVEECKKLQEIKSKSAKWIASDALRELTSEAIQNRLKTRGK